MVPAILCLSIIFTFYMFLAPGKERWYHWGRRLGGLQIQYECHCVESNPGHLSAGLLASPSDFKSVLKFRVVCCSTLKGFVAVHLVKCSLREL
jgi:hypothetical protein